MSVSVLQRPQGVILGDCFAASIDEDYTGFATVNTYTPHNLTEGQVVYVTSYIEDYNGFFPVHIIDGFHFFLIDPHGNYVDYVQDAGITYCASESEHGWNCAHLPIAYRLRSDLYPVNEVDTERTVSSYSNDNGLVNLNLSGSLGTFDELSWMFIDGAESEEVNGVFQVMNKVSTSDVTIDLAYSSLYDFTGATVILHYGSYNIIVKVYSGLPAGHRWEARKPVTEVAELRLIPDENNEVFFSIAEILKASVESTNNPLLGSLPNNLNAFTGFYISYGESYDLSDGYTLNTYESSLTDDPFQGWAINAKLPFKNQFSGSMSEYLDPARFLTLFQTVRAFVGRYFDLSFINRFSSYPLSTEVVKKLNGTTVTTQTISHGVTDQGVIRVPITIESAYDQYCIQVSAGAYVENQVVGGTPFDLEDFQNGTGNPWILGANPEYDNSDGSALLYLAYPVLSGIPVTINYNLNVNSLSAPFGVYFTLTNSTSAIGDSTIVPISSTGFKSGTVIVTATTNKAYFAVFLSGPGVAKKVVLSSLSEGASSIVPVTIPGFTLSEQICIDIDNQCSPWDIYLGWLNNLGGYDYWLFRGAKDYILNIEGTEEVQDNIFPNWPNSYGENAHTINKQVSRDSRKQILVRTDHITLEQLQALEMIKKSISVHIVNSRQDIRTVIVDADSFTVYKDEDKLYTMSFTISYTNKEAVQRR